MAESGFKEYLNSCIFHEIPRWRFGMTCNWGTCRGKEAASRNRVKDKWKIITSAARRFFSYYFPKNPVIPNSEKPELAEVWRNEGSPYHSRYLVKTICI